MMALLFDHLWQSTLFVAVAGILATVLRNNRAVLRYWLWLAASAKFLLPIGLLAALGSLLPTPGQLPEVSTKFLYSVDPAIEPFSAPEPVINVPAANGSDFETYLLVIWAVGALSFLSVSLLRWWHLRVMLRSAVVMPSVGPLRVRSSFSCVEPALVGIFHPVLLLPAGITEHLSSDEMNAVVAHELCHLRRRDNLAAAAHMAVQALFWFYPPVWWLGRKLIEERERACDEAVLATGADPNIYAESILKVCKFYLRSPLICAAGLSGADLRSRIEAVLRNRAPFTLGKAKKLLLTFSAFGVSAIAVFFGIVSTPLAMTETFATPTLQVGTPGAEAAVLRTIKEFRSGKIDETEYIAPLAGTIQPLLKGFSIRIQGWGAVKSIAFKGIDAGWDVYDVVHDHALSEWRILLLPPEGKIGVLYFSKVFPRSNNLMQSPGTEAALRRTITDLSSGKLNANDIAPDFLDEMQKAVPPYQKQLNYLGALKSLTFKSVNSLGLDVYEASFTRGQLEWLVAPLSPEGKIQSLAMRLIYPIVKGGKPHPGTQASLARFIASLQNGRPNYEEMTSKMANVVRLQLPIVGARIRRLGAARDITFMGHGVQTVAGQGVQGTDIYEVTFANKKAQWIIGPLTADGKVQSIGYLILN